jgi:hypothetical protein
MDIPGAYPESPAPTSPNTYQHILSPLHKTQDPTQHLRGHSHADSGVGLAESEFTQLSVAHEPKVHEVHQLGVRVPEVHEPEVHKQEDYETQANKLVAIEPHGRESKIQDPNVGDTARNDHASQQTLEPSYHADNAPVTPGWSALPTATGGGIYNTVMGYGSPSDDHSDHHRLPPKVASADEPVAYSTITRPATKYPPGGVYNTVTGHGSHEAGQQKREEFLSDAPDSSSSKHGCSIAGATAASAVDKITTVGKSAAPTTTDFELGNERDLAPGADDHDAVKNADLRRSAGYAVGGGAVAAAVAAASVRDGDTPEKKYQVAADEHISAQAPVGTGIGSDRGLTSKSLPHNDQFASTQHNTNTRTNAGLAPGVGIAGGFAPSELVDKYRKEPQTAAPMTEQGRHSNEHKNVNTSADVVSHKRHDETRSAERLHKHKEETYPAEKGKNEEDKNHKKSGLFGIFHRHKDNKEDPPNSPTSGISEDKHGHRAKLTKEPPPAIAAALADKR